MQLGDSVNVKNKNGWTPLHYAVRNRNLNIVKLLIENGADVNLINDQDETPLHQAVLSENYNMVKLLIKHGADPFIKNNRSKTPLEICNNEEIRQLLEEYIKYYKQRSEIPSIENNDLLYYAFGNNLIKVKICVYSENYNINVQDDKGYTPLMYAITNHNLQMVEFLVEHGANVNLCNKKDQSPLEIAYLYNAEDIATYLLEKGAKDLQIDKQNREK